MWKNWWADAKGDSDENLLEPMWALMHMGTAQRQYKRFLTVMGGLARAKGFLKSSGVVILVWGLIFGALFANEEMNPLIDVIFATFFGGMIGVLMRAYVAYQSAFVKCYVMERADFTDPGQVTGICTIYQPRLAYYFRPDVWRGNGGHNGISDNAAYIVVKTGYDIINWLPEEEQLEDADEWCTIERTKCIPDFRVPSDYHELPADTYTVRGDSMKMRRAWCRQLQRNGALHGKYERGGLAWLDGKWGWIYAGVCGICAFFIITISMG